MSESSEELRRMLVKMQGQLDAVRSKRAAQPPSRRAPQAAPLSEAPAVPIKISRAREGGRLVRLVGTALGACAAVAGLAFGRLDLIVGGFSAAIGFLAWGAAFSETGGGAGVEELARRIAALERKVASGAINSGGAGLPLEEEIQELRVILQSLMKALENPPGS